MNSAIENLNQFGGQFLKFAWPMLWQSSLLILLVLMVDVLTARKIRASVRHALWLVVLVKLLLPPTLALPTGAAWWLFPAKPVVLPAVQPPVANNYTVVVDDAPLPADFAPEPVPRIEPPKPKLTGAGWTLLACGVVSAGLLGWLLFRWCQLTRKVRGAAKILEAASPGNIAEAFERARQRAGLRAGARLKLVEGRMSPAVCGLFRPVILLPRLLVEKLSASQLQAVLLHEMIHLRRKDIWVNCAQSVLQIFYWWHPLVWVANARIRRVREEAVDDAVMLALAEDAETYAPTLLEVAKVAFRRPLLSLGLVGIMESRSALRQRIERLMDFRAPRKAGLTFVSVCGIFVFSAVAIPMGQGPARVIREISPSPTFDTSNTNPVTATGILSSPNFQTALRELQKRTGVEKLGEPEITTERLRTENRAGIFPARSVSFDSQVHVQVDDVSENQTGARPFVTTVAAREPLSQAEMPAQTNKSSVAENALNTLNDVPGNPEFLATLGAQQPRNEAENLVEPELALRSAGQTLNKSLSLADLVRELPFLRGLLTSNTAATFNPRYGYAADPTPYVSDSAQAGQIPRYDGIIVDLASSFPARSAPNATMTLAEAAGPSASPAGEPKTNTPQVMISAEFYLMRAGDFESLTSGLQFNRGTEDEGEWWSGARDEFSKIQSGLKTDGLVPMSRPRILTFSGRPVQMHVGNEMNGIELDCLPLVNGTNMDLKISGEVVNGQEGVAVTNQFKADAPVQNKGGMVIRAQNGDGSGASNVVVLLTAKILSESASAQFQQRLVRIIKPAATNDAVETQTNGAALEMRTFRMDANVFLVNLLSQPGLDLSGSRDYSIRALFRKVASKEGVDWQSPPGKECFSNESGYLFVKATASDLDLIEKLVVKLNSPGAATLQSANVAGLPVPNPYATNHLIHTGPGRQAIVAKLDKIHLDTVSFDGLPLNEVLKHLAKQCRESDPERKGVNFLIYDAALAPQVSLPNVTTVAGIVAPAATAEQPDVGSYIIKIPSLSDVRLADVLDAITLVSDHPLKYSIQDFAVVFSAKSPDSQQLFMRTFRVDPNTFYSGLESVSAQSFGAVQNGGSGGSGQGQNNGAVVGVVNAFPGASGVLGTGGGGGSQGGSGSVLNNNLDVGGGGGSRSEQSLQGMSYGTHGSTAPNPSAAARTYFTSLGVNLNDPPGKSVFYNDGMGYLFVKATKTDLDKIEHGLQALNQAPPPELHIKARFLEVPKGTLKDFDKILNVTNSFDDTPMGILTSQNAKAALQALRSRKGVEALAEPEITMPSGRRAEIRSTQVQTIITNIIFKPPNDTPQTTLLESGSVLNTSSHVLPDGHTINISGIVSETTFYGYATKQVKQIYITNSVGIPTITNSAGELLSPPMVSPAAEIRRGSALANLYDGQTLVLSGLKPEQVRFAELDAEHEAAVAKFIHEAQMRNGEKEIIVFITATIVDSNGARVHSDADLPFAQDGIPPQPVEIEKESRRPAKFRYSTEGQDLVPLPRTP